MTDHPTAQNWISIAVLGVIWGGTFMVVRLALNGYGPLTVACARTTLGAVATLAVVLVLRRSWPQLSRGAWGMMGVMGITNTALPFFLLSWGQQHVPSAFAGITMAALPLFVLPMAHVFSDEKMHARRVVGVVIGFAGALVLIGPGLASLGDGSAPLAQLACLAATLSYAVSSILTRRAPPMDSLVLSAITLLFGSATLIPLMLIVEGLPRWQGGGPGWAIIFLGLMPTAFAAYLRVNVVRTAGSVFMTLVNYQVPLWAMLFGAVIMGEDLPLRFFGALALILAGLAVSQWRSLMGLLRPR